MKEYFHDRRQFVQFNQSSLALQNHMRRSALYSILGPLFFLFFVTDLCRVSRIMKLQLFADDAYIFLLGKDHMNIWLTRQILNYLKLLPGFKQTSSLWILKRPIVCYQKLIRVTLICLLFTMLVIINFWKCHTWKEKKRQLTNQTS